MFAAAMKLSAGAWFTWPTDKNPPKRPDSVAKAWSKVAGDRAFAAYKSAAGVIVQRKKD